jgi:hypothetical protein
MQVCSSHSAEAGENSNLGASVRVMWGVEKLFSSAVKCMPSSHYHNLASVYRRYEID